MIQKHSQHTGASIPAVTTPAPIAVSSLQNLSALGRLVGELKADFDDGGAIRFLTGTDLFPVGKGATALDTALAFIASAQGKRVLQLRNIHLTLGEVKEFNLFTRVELKQIVTFNGEELPVRGGYIHAFVDKDLRLIQVNSTVRRGKKPRTLGPIVSEAVAVALAKSQLDAGPTEVVSSTLVLSAHEACLNPMYEVVLATYNPRQVVLFLVDAKTGAVVHTESKLHICLRSAKVDGISVLTFPRIPDYSKDVKSQTGRVFIDPAELPDPTVLANERYKMLIPVKGKWVPVKANAQGNFEFDPTSSDPVVVSSFAASLLFEWLNTQDATFESWGGIRIPRPIPVKVDDVTVENNAFFDPTDWEITEGVGTGIENGGLAVHLSFDSGVPCHENTHKRNAAEAPGKDLPGPQGGAANEATADVMGDLLFDFWNRLKNSDVLGHTFTVQDIISDPAIIGKYCAYPMGIRSQRNKKMFPQDIVNEVHTDGLIIGGAFFDLLVAMASVPGADAEDVLVTFGKIYLQGTRLLPAHKVLFTDYVRAFITADGLLTGGKNKALIVSAFAGHGIKLQTVSAGKAVSFV